MKIAGFVAGAALGTLAVTLCASPALATEENKDWSVEAGIAAAPVPQDREYSVTDREYNVRDREYSAGDRAVRPGVVAMLGAIPPGTADAAR